MLLEGSAKYALLELMQATLPLFKFWLIIIVKHESRFSQAATKQVESKGGELSVLQNKTLNVKEERENQERENNLEAKQRFVFSNILLRDMLG